MKKKMFFFRIFPFFLLILLAFQMPSCKETPIPEPTVQYGKIKGKVKDLNGIALSNVTISAEGLNDTITNANGEFFYEKVEVKTYTLKASKTGYLIGNLDVKVVADKTVEPLIQLKLGDKPTVSTNTVEKINMTKAEVSGRLNAIGSSEITEYGHCWGTTSNPTVEENSITNFGTSNTVNQPFTSNLEDLTPNTQYYVRAYAENNFGIVYSSQVTFQTLPGEPTVMTNAATDIQFNKAQIIGNVTALGASNLTQHGHVWSKSPNPTLSDFKTTLGAKSTTGNFTSTLENLEMETTYYVRAYATNNSGTTYSNQEIFTTNNRFKDSRDAKWYDIVKINGKIWLKQNLNYDAPNSICYQFSDYDCSIYGRFYRFSDAAAALPNGWRLPTETDFNELITFLNGTTVAGGKMKDANINGTVSKYWQAPNLGATDESGFKAYGSGYLNKSNQPIEHQQSAMFWTSTAANSTQGRCLRLHTNNTEAQILSYDKDFFFSIRCILIQ
jgi:uncharacterized protein (TIGR02145 family)